MNSPDPFLTSFFASEDREQPSTRRHAPSLGIVVAALLATTAADALTRTGDATTTFHAKGPGGMIIDGTTRDLDVHALADGIHVVVPLANLDTGIALRNRHMREKYLEVARFPNAELIVQKDAADLAGDGQRTSHDLKGTMTIHGVTRPVSIHATISRSGARREVQGTVALDLRDFAIVVPSYLGVTVKPEIVVESRFAVNDP